MGLGLGFRVRVRVRVRVRLRVRVRVECRVRVEVSAPCRDRLARPRQVSVPPLGGPRRRVGPAGWRERRVVDEELP